MLALAAVIVLLVCRHASSCSSQLEVVPANLVLCFQCPAQLGWQLPGAWAGSAFPPAIEIVQNGLLQQGACALLRQVFLQSRLGFLPSLLGTVKMVAFDHVHCGLLVLAALRASVVVPFFAEVHGPAHSAPAGAVLAEPTSHAFGLFLESLFGSLPIGVIEGLLG